MPLQFHGSGVLGIPRYFFGRCSVRSPRVSPGDPTLSGGRGTLRNLVGPERQPAAMDIVADVLVSFDTAGWEAT